MLRLVLQLVALWSQLFRNCRRRIALEAAYALAASKQNFCTEKCTEKTAPEIDWQDEVHRGILRGLRNISETP